MAAGEERAAILRDAVLRTAPQDEGQAFGVFVRSFAGHCSDKGGRAISLPVMRSTVMAYTVMTSIRGKKPLGRSVPGLPYFAISASQKRCLMSRSSTTRIRPNRHTLR